MTNKIKKPKKANELTNREVTAQATRDILDLLFADGVLASRNNTLPVPLVREGVHVGFRPGSRSGRPDIEGIYPAFGGVVGVSILIEIKTGPDKLRDIQESYLAQASRLGAIVMVVKDVDDFKKKWLNVRDMFHLLEKSLR